MEYKQESEGMEGGRDRYGGHRDSCRDRGRDHRNIVKFDKKHTEEDGRCYRCNMTGHQAKECKLDKSCYNCNHPGHIARECPKSGRYDSQGRSNQVCYNCKRIGHRFRYCKEPQIFCLLCASFGHVSRDCNH
ncbi:cellular nucleic acid-binding protein-like [Ctenocephalides felis]|uniref:cellular nucleic acid-binding protein-like n=1 Tax=Ctenocephalides felis TaxID=7515 RepID=UPI000E6E232D|nr:cellular nucleic acid-binding protein-like [Ctenocephalides felis]